MSKRKVLTLDDRVRVIEMSKFKSARKIAEEMQVGKTQIQNILKRKAEVLEDVENNVSGDRKRARRITGNEVINNLVLEWFKDATARRIPVSGPILMQQALKFASDLENNTFKASTGWLSSFIKRNNIVFGTMSCERGYVNKEVLENWKSNLPTICQGYEPKDIFNMDETGLFYQDTTKKSFHLKDQELAGGKRSKERLTVSLCASMTGEKLKPLVIGKSAHPRCFSKVKPENLPLTYRSNKKAWMTSDLMTEWLRSVDKKMKKQGRHILLFLDNAPAHPKVALSNIKLVFLPANTTSLSQPMDQGIIQTLKLKYRARQLKHINIQMERTSKCGSDILRDISVLDAIYWINGAWNEVESVTIQKCFAKAGFTADVCLSEVNFVSQDNKDDDDDDSDDDIPLVVLRMSQELFGVEFQDLVQIDQSVPVCNTISERNWDLPAKDLLKTMNHDDDNESDDNDDSDQSVPEQDVITIAEAHDMLDKIKLLALSKGQNKWLDSIMNLQEQFVSSRAEVQCTQSKISDFFKSK